MNRRPASSLGSLLSQLSYQAVQSFDQWETGKVTAQQHAVRGRNDSDRHQRAVVRRVRLADRHERHSSARKLRTEQRKFRFVFRMERHCKGAGLEVA